MGHQHTSLHFAARSHHLLLALACLAFASLAQAQQSDLPDGQGKDTVQRMCTQCHSLSVVTGQRMSREHWADQVEDMVSRGAKGSPSDIQLVIQYLSAFYGNDTEATTAAPSTGAGRHPTSSAPAKPSGPIPLDELVPASQNSEPEEKPGIFVSHADPAHLTGVTPARILHAENEPENWLTFNGTYRSNHYTRLNQITPENVKNLQLKWIFQTHWLDPYEATPIVADGVLYTTQGNDVVALDAESGRMFWIYRYTPAADSRLCCGRITRGLAIHGNTLYLAAVDAHLVAIDARTGNPLWDTHVAR
ncbi:MAG: PQQ-binding-like beta-propeller repeat protein, partial [Chthonomonadales bacterium]